MGWFLVCRVDQQVDCLKCRPQNSTTSWTPGCYNLFTIIGQLVA